MKHHDPRNHLRHRTALGIGTPALTAAMLAPGAGAETDGVQGGDPDPGHVGGI